MLLYPKWLTLLYVYKHLVAVTAYYLSNRLLLTFKFFFVYWHIVNTNLHHI